MKRILLALSAVAALTVAGAASAQDVQVGPGGVDVGPRHHYYDTDRDRGCRIIIDHHVGPSGNSVTIRRRICD